MTSRPPAPPLTGTVSAASGAGLVSGDLRLAAPAISAWITAAMLIGLPDAAPWFCALAWTTTAILALTALHLLQRRGRHARSSRLRPPWAHSARASSPPAVLIPVTGSRDRRDAPLRRDSRLRLHPAPGRGSRLPLDPPLRRDSRLPFRPPRRRHLPPRRDAPLRRRHPHRSPSPGSIRDSLLPGLTASLGVVLLTTAAAAMIATAIAAQLPARHPPDIAGPAGSRSGQATLTIAGLPERAKAGPFDTPPTSASRDPVLPTTAASGDPATPAAPASGHHRAPTRILVDAQLTRFDTGGRGHTARAPVLLFATVDDPATLRIGSTVTARGTLTAATPGEAHEFLFFARGSPAVTAAPPWWLAWADQMRTAFRHSIRGLPGDGRALLTGLAIGDDREVGDDLVEAMTTTGLTHLTAVSGANCAIVVGAVVLAGGAAGLGRRTRILLALAVLVPFVVLVTPQPSVLRAATMAVIVLAASLAGRPGAGIPPLCLSVVALLVVDPWLSRSAGFALSVLATAGLLLLTRPLAAVAARVLPEPLALAFGVPVAAQLACQPVLFLIAPQLTPYTVPANLLAEPAAALVSVLGLIVCVLAVIAPRLAELLAWLPWAPSAWIAAVARFFADLPFAIVPVTDSAAAAAGSAVLAAAVVFWLTAWRRRPRLARTTALLTAVGLVVLTGSAAGTTIARSGGIPRDWVIAACDIGQGDAVLVRDVPSGAVALVDVGPDPEPLADCLTRLHLDRIDLLVLTHYDLDHVGGLDAVTGRVDTALVGPPDGAADERMLAQLSAGGARVVAAARGMTGALGRTEWTVLWPQPRTPLRGNDASVTLTVDGPLDALFLGDLGERAQDAVRGAGGIPSVDLVKVAHHGSADQSGALYDEADARVGIISVGADNDYGHPTPQLLAMLAHSGTAPFRTDRLGLVTVSVRAGDLAVWGERAGTGAVGGSG